MDPSQSALPQPPPHPSPQQRQQQLSDSTAARVAALRVEFPGWDGVVPVEDVEHWSANDLRLFAGSGGYLTPPHVSKPRPASMATAAASTAETHELARNLPRRDQSPIPPPLPTKGGNFSSNSSKEANSRSLPNIRPHASANTGLATPADAASGATTTGSRNTVPASGAGRWFLDVNAWQPSAAEWALALAQLSDPERLAVQKFVFEKDRKLAMGSRLLQRYAVREALGIGDGDFAIGRTKEKKPFLEFGDPAAAATAGGEVCPIRGRSAGGGTTGTIARNACAQRGFSNFNFNATHHGRVVALACEPTLVVGVDVMNEGDVPGGCRSAEEFFESFETSFTAFEWRIIRNGYPGDNCGGPSLHETSSPPSSGNGARISKLLAGGDAGAFRRFYRLWALKEAYIKAHGLGLGIDLQSIEFRLEAVNQSNESNDSIKERGAGDRDEGRDQEGRDEGCAGGAGSSSRDSGGNSSGSGGYVWRVCVDGAQTSAKHWAFTLERVDDRHVVCVALAPPQDCHPGYTQHLLRPNLSDVTCQSALAVATSTSGPPSRTFIEVSFAQLLQPSAQAQLHALRHPNVPPIVRLEPPAHAFHAAAAVKTTPAVVGAAATAATGSAPTGSAGSKEIEVDWWQRWRRWLFATVPLPPPRSSQEVGEASSSSMMSHSSPVLRVYALSDLHCDFKDNMAWVNSLPSCPRGSHLIVAGDVSHSLAVVERTLRVLQSKFDEVFYTVGNHELWLDRADYARGDRSSLDKLMSLLELCDALGVRTRPTLLRPVDPVTGEKALASPDHLNQKGATVSASSSSPATSAVVAVPLLSWYGTDLFRPTNEGSNNSSSSSSGSSIGGSTKSSASDDQTVREELTWGLSQLEEHFDAQCRWPPPLGLAGDPTFSLAPNIAPFMASLNDQILAQSLPLAPPPTPGATGGRMPNRVDASEVAAARSTPLLTFSHFLPDPRLYPGRPDLKHVMGSRALRQQVLDLAPLAHVFGHSHIKVDTQLPFDGAPSDSTEKDDPRGRRGGEGNRGFVGNTGATKHAGVATSTAASPSSASPSWCAPHGLQRSPKTRFVQASLGYPAERGHRKPSLNRIAQLWPLPHS